MAVDRDLAKAIAEEVAQRLSAQRAPGPSPANDADEPAVGYLWPMYERAEKRDLKSWQTKEGRMRLHVLPFFRDRRPDEITLALCDEYRDVRLGQVSARGKPPAQASINRELEDLRRLLSWAKHRKYISRNPLADVERDELLKDEDNVRRSIYESATLEQILGAGDECLGDYALAFRALILTKVDSGMRRGEVVTLQWPQMDEKNGVIRVWWSKTDEPRETDWSERAIEAVIRMHDWATLRGVQANNRWVFASPVTHDHFHPDTVTGWMRRVCEHAQLEGPDGRYWLHDARHTFATMADRAGVSLPDAMDMSGHKTTAMWTRYHVGNRRNLMRAKEKMRALRESEREKK